MYKVYRDLKDFVFPFNTRDQKKKEVMLKGKSAQIVWLYLRQNQSYRDSFKSFTKEVRNTSSQEERENLAEQFQLAWSISHPLDCEEAVIPRNLHFKFKRVWLLKNGKFTKEIIQNADYLFGEESKERKSVDGLPPRPITLVLNPMADQATLMSEVKNVLDKEFKRHRLTKNYSLQPSHNKSLVENAFLYHCKHIDKLRLSEIKSRYCDVFDYGEKELTSNQVKDRLTTFNKISSSAPWCFFEAVMCKANKSK